LRAGPYKVVSVGRKFIIIAQRGALCLDAPTMLDMTNCRQLNSYPSLRSNTATRSTSLPLRVYGLEQLFFPKEATLNSKYLFKLRKFITSAYPSRTRTDVAADPVNNNRFNVGVI